MVIIVVLAIATVGVLYWQFFKDKSGTADQTLKGHEEKSPTPSPGRFSAQAHVTFLYCGEDVDCITDAAMYAIADNLRWKIQIALIPIQDDIVASGGSVTFDFPQWFKKVDVRMKGMDESLEHLIISAIPSLKTL